MVAGSNLQTSDHVTCMHVYLCDSWVINKATAFSYTRHLKYNTERNHLLVIRQVINHDIHLHHKRVVH